MMLVRGSVARRTSRLMADPEHLDDSDCYHAACWEALRS
jgi:hypothetical protein